MNGQERYRLRRNAIFAELGDGSGVVLDLNSKAYFTLNSTGVVVWKELAAEPTDVERLAERVTTEFEVETERARADVADLISRLDAEGLVESIPSSAPPP